MTFATLEERFNATSNTLYKRYENTEQLEVILPDSQDSRSRIKNDTRAVPVVSTARDLKLMGKYLKSFEKGGPQFLATQQFLQTGNTFAETRFNNPLGALIHTVPFVHKPRNIPLSPLRDKRGALQQETINSFEQARGGLVGRFLSGAVNAASSALSPVRALATSPKPDPSGQFYLRPEDKFFVKNNTYFPLLAKVESKQNRGSKKEIQFISDTALSGIDVGYYALDIVNRKFKYEENSGTYSEIKSIPQTAPVRPNSPVPSGNGVSKPYSELLLSEDNKKRYSAFNINPRKDDKPIILSANVLPNPETQRPTSTDADRRRFNDIKAKYGNSVITPYTASLTFKSLEDKLNSNGYFQTTLAGYKLLEPTSIETIKRQTGSIVDPYNTPLTPAIAQGATSTPGIRSTSYLSISGEKQEKSDIIKFIFKAVDRDEPVHFRALISNIKENVKPEYNETKYVGRTERFVTYAGAKRTVSLDFNVVAFSLNELDQMWTRINYLTGLAFPRDASDSGFMIPPLFRLTIGGIYDSQPCYVESLNFTMLDESITFDIDKEVSQTIAVSMTISLLEKRSRFYNSPFYEIVQKTQEREMKILEGIVR